MLLISASPLPLCSNHVVLIDPAGLVQHTSNHIIRTTGSTEAQAGLIGCKQFEMSGAAVDLRLLNGAKVIIEQAAFGLAMSELTVAYPYTPTPLSSKSMG